MLEYSYVSWDDRGRAKLCDRQDKSIFWEVSAPYIDKFLLGTVQLGLSYGINNTEGKPPLEKAHLILEKAFMAGMRTLDTAEAYGDSQQVIGTFHQKHSDNKFNIITKLSPNAHFEKEEELRYHINTTLQQLSTDRIDTYMFHHFKSYQEFLFWDVLMDAVAKQQIKKIGVSVYTNQEVNTVAHDKRISTVQMPYNLLDNENLRGESIQLLKKQGKEVHTRSVFLQGLFFKPKELLPESLKPLLPYLNKILVQATQYGVDLQSLALAYVFTNPTIDKVLIGVESVAQLEQNLQLLAHLDKVPAELLDFVQEICVKETELLNPSKWQ